MSIDLDIPNPWDFNIDADMSANMGISIHELPKIILEVAPLEIKPLDISMELKPLAMSMEIKPLDMSFRLKEIPSVRAHFPVDYKVCFGFLGIEIASIRFCGQAQIISEPYVPNPCELRVQRLVQPDPQTQPLP
jgi:hypothetical protein